MSDKPEPSRIIDPADIASELPEEARCHRPIPHSPHRHEANWRDLIAAYWCDGT